MPANEAIPEASGDVIPHETNPASMGIDDDVSRAMAAAQKAADDAAGAGQSADEPAPGAGSDDKVSLGGENEAGAEGASSEAASEAPASGSEDPGEGAGEGDAAQPPPPLDPPTTWDAEVQDVFRSMPRDAQEWVLERHEADVAAVRAEFDGLDPYRALHRQWSPYFTQHGFEPGTALNNLLTTEYTLRTGTPEQKLAALQNIVQSYGLAQVMQPGAQAPGAGQQLPEDVQNDPLFTALNGRIETLANSVQSLTTQFGQQMQGLQQQQQTDSRAAVEAFWAETDAAGKPAHPYRQEVEPMMQAIAQAAISAGQTPALKDVYDQACWGTPSVRAKLQSAERAAGIAERKAQAEKKAQASKSVSGSPGGQANGAVDYDPAETVEQTIAKAMALHSGSSHA